MAVAMRYGAPGDGAVRPSGRIDTLWTNSSPTSNFTAQDISDISLTNYDLWAVEMRYSTSSAINLPLCVYPVDEETHLGPLSAQTNNNNGGRRFTYSESNSAVSVTASYYNGSTNNSYAIPIAIYGIKF